MDEIVLEDHRLFFWLKSGKGLRSLRELADALPTIPRDEFRYHCNEEKNDFANWIEGVFHEEALAARLRLVSSKDEFQSVIYNALLPKALGREKAKQDGAPRPASPADDLSSKNEEKVVDKVFRTDVARTMLLEQPTDEQRIVKDPARFATYHAEDSVRKDALADRFDAVSRRFVENAHPETPESVTSRIERLTERYRELRQKVSDARKQGKDLLIADLTLRPVLSKIEYARLSRAERDFQLIETILREAELELADALAFVEPNAKRDVATLVGAPQGKSAKELIGQKPGSRGDA